MGHIPQYIALEIRTFDGLADAHGALAFDDGGGSLLPAVPQQIVSISSCPGDFHQESIMEDTGCYEVGNWLIPFYWRGPDAEKPINQTSDCILQPGRTYYWNFIPTISPPGTAPEDLVVDPVCLGGVRCGWLYNPLFENQNIEDFWSEICDPELDICP